LLQSDRHDLYDLILREDIVEDAKRLNAKLPFRQIIRPEALPISCLTRRFVCQLGLDGGDHSPLIECPQGFQIIARFRREFDTKHGSIPPAQTVNSPVGRAPAFSQPSAQPSKTSEKAQLFNDNLLNKKRYIDHPGVTVGNS
jgi:hypothetical protein